MENLIKEMKQHGEIIGFKILTALVGFCCCFAIFVGACFGLTQMSFLQSVGTAVFPSMLFGVWCGFTAMDK